MSFTTVHLKSQNIPKLCLFYCNILGMRKSNCPNGVEFGFTDKGCKLEFQDTDGTYQAGPNDLYWKIGITVDDLDYAVGWMKKNNWPVSEPRQFQDIGYLCHTKDPNGFTIELLQKGFQGNAAPIGEGHPIAAQATLAHITLRVTEINTAKHFCENDLELNLLSVQPVPNFGFTLYFYGFELEKLPNSNLDSVENREWLWRRPYTILELQHLEHAHTDVQKTEADQAGFHGISIKPKNDDIQTLTLQDLSQFR